MMSLIVSHIPGHSTGLGSYGTIKNSSHTYNTIVLCIGDDHDSYVCITIKSTFGIMVLLLGLKPKFLNIYLGI